MIVWTVIRRFATRINAEGFITEQRTRKNTKHHDSALLLVCDPEAKDQLWWLVLKAESDSANEFSR